MEYKRVIILKKTLGIAALFVYLHTPAHAHNWMAPEDESRRQNPVPATEESVRAGESLFKGLCSACHGIDAQGLKMAVTGLSMDTPSLPQRLENHSEGDFHWKILNGRGEMPSFKDELGDQEVWNIINYLKTK